MSDEQAREPTEDEREAEALWQARQESYRRAVQAWQRYPAPTDADPLAEVRDRDEKLRGGVG